MSAMRVSFGPWSIGRRPSVIRTRRVTSMTTLSLLGGGGGAQNEQAARNNPPELRNTEHWGKCCDRFMSDAFRVILHSFTILLLVIYLNLNFTNTLYILKQKKSATNKNNRRNLKWSSLHGRMSYSLHCNKKVSIFIFPNGYSIKILVYN